MNKRKEIASSEGIVEPLWNRSKLRHKEKPFISNGVFNVHSVFILSINIIKKNSLMRCLGT